jgi:phosphatidylserine/phosphatidylglycerophosphate/cardiolipin synthase-like enzyme
LDGLMHVKIIIIDGSILWMGSWNASYNDTFRNNNNLLRITDPALIADYQVKFDEMFVERRFGAQARVGAIEPVLTLDGVRVENYFSPVDEVMAKLVEYVRSARKSIRFFVFTYTHPDLSEAMIERFKAGLIVEGVIENRGALNGVLVPLFCASVPVKVDGNKYTMHHKVIIIDDAIVITGSFNFTKAADEVNDDNVLIIHDPAIAALYLQEYRRVSSIGQTPDKAEIDCSQVK